MQPKMRSIRPENEFPLERNGNACEGGSRSLDEFDQVILPHEALPAVAGDVRGIHATGRSPGSAASREGEKVVRTAIRVTAIDRAGEAQVGRQGLGCIPVLLIGV